MALPSLPGLGSGGLPLPTDALSSLPGLLTGGLGGLSGGAGGLPGLGSLPISGLMSGGLPGLSALGGLPGLGGGGGLPGLDILTSGGLPGLSALGALGGTAAGVASSGGENGVTQSGDLSQLSGAIGGPLMTLAGAAGNIPLLGGVIQDSLGIGREGNQIEDIIATQLFGTPLEGVGKSLFGGNTQGDELILYNLAAIPGNTTSKIPVVGGLVGDVLFGGVPNVGNFLGVYSGGVLSEDFLQALDSREGTLGALAKSLNEPASRLPGVGPLLGDNSIDALLDQVTLATDQAPYADDIVAFLLGGTDLSATPPGFALLQATGLTNMIPGALAPLAGPIYEGVLQPLTVNIQEVAIAGPLATGTIGHLF